MKTINVFIENTYEEFLIDEVKVLNNLKKITKAFLNDEEVYPSSCLVDYDFDTLCFDVVFCNNEEIQRINREYRKKDKPTDVISFAMFADAPKEERFVLDGEINIGEIIVSLDKIKEQAEENGNTFAQELYFLLAHGVLHCFGFDHLNENDFQFMMDKQEKVKVKIGV